MRNKNTSLPWWVAVKVIKALTGVVQCTCRFSLHYAFTKKDVVLPFSRDAGQKSSSFFLLLRQKKSILKSKKQYFGTKNSIFEKISHLNIQNAQSSSLKKTAVPSIHTRIGARRAYITCVLFAMCAVLGQISLYHHSACIVWRRRCIIHLRHKAHDQKLRKTSLKKKKKNLKSIIL